MMHQLLWVRRMVDILGANAGTFSRVTAAFFLGLAIGAWLAARRKTPRPWRSVAGAESCVAVLAAGVLLAGLAAPAGFVLVGSMRGLQWILPLLLITPAAAAMGAVLPWMLRAVPTSSGVLLYGVNTLGGIAGLAVAGVWALPALGLNGASVMAVAVNIIIAGVAWLLSRQASSEIDSSVVVGQRPSSEDAVLSFASGFLVLAAEVIYQRQFAQLLISSHFSGALVLALVLGALGVAALLTPLLARLGGGGLAVVLSVAAVTCALQPFILVVQRGGLNFLPFDQTHWKYLGAALRLGTPGCALPLLAAGCVFPLLLRRAALAGVDAGWLLAVNGLGGWFGAECAERILAPTFGLWWATTVLAAGYALCLAWQRGALRLWLLPAVTICLVWTWKIDRRLPFAALNSEETLVRVGVGREGVVGVVHGAPDDWRIIFNNTYTLGGSRAKTNQERQMLLPMLLHGDARRVAALGVATGSSLAGATLDPVLEQAEGIELSPLVLRYARDYFAPFNRGVTSDPRVRLTLGDARIVITQRAQTFDVIEGDLFLPWRTGEGRLFTLEHFSGVRAALRPNGIYCQWLPAYQLTRPQFETILRTFREVFPEVWMVRGDFYVGRPIVGLIGGRSFADINWAGVAAACERVRGRGLCADPLLRHAEGVAMCVVGPAPVPPRGPLNTLGNAWLEWDAATNVIGLKESWFAGVPFATYLRDLQQASAHLLPVDLQAAQKAGELCVALEVARNASLSQGDQTEALLHARLPAVLRRDTGADWQHWPMHFRPSLP